MARSGPVGLAPLTPVVAWGRHTGTLTGDGGAAPDPGCASRLWMKPGGSGMQDREASVESSAVDPSRPFPLPDAAISSEALTSGSAGAPSNTVNATTTIQPPSSFSTDQ